MITLRVCAHDQFPQSLGFRLALKLCCFLKEPQPELKPRFSL